MKKYICYPLFLLLILLNSCIQENDELVYPPLIVETVQIRYFNLHKDEAPRTFILDKKPMGDNIPFNSASTPQFPPYDSATVQIMKGDFATYVSKLKFRFARQSNYVMVALPDYRILPDSVVKYEDTIVYIQTTILKPDDTNQCFIKFLNCNPDTNFTYSIKIGCPNGEDLFIDNSITSVSYLQSTGIQAIYEGQRVISIIKNKKNIDSGSADKEVVGIYELDLKKLGQYALMMNKNDELFFINELDANSPIIKLNAVEARNAYIRVVNLSSDDVVVNSSLVGDITSNLNSDFVDDYKDITTCEATTLDKITLATNGNVTDTIFMSFDIYKKYSIFAFDIENTIAGKIIGVPPIDDRMKPQSNKAIVRVVNGNITKSGITVSIGARGINNDDGYESGITLAVNLLNGEYSEPIYINGGTIPLSVFASTQPTKYMFSAMLNIQNGKEYIITIDANEKIAAVELNDEKMPIQYGVAASFLQFVNVCNGNNTLEFTIPELIANGKLSASKMLATFVPVGNNSIQVAGKNFDFNATKNERTLLVATSNPNDPTLFAIQNQNMGADNSSFRFRFINASDNTSILQVNEMTSDTTYNLMNRDIAYQTSSEINRNNKDRKYSFSFMNQQTGEILCNDCDNKNTKPKDKILAKDILMTLNKNYSIIFYGNNNKNIGYGIFIVQEY